MNVSVRTCTGVMVHGRKEGSADELVSTAWDLEYPSFLLLVFYEGHATISKNSRPTVDQSSIIRPGSQLGDGFLVQVRDGWYMTEDLGGLFYRADCDLGPMECNFCLE